MSRCLSIVLNAFTHDSRVMRQCETLASEGLEVELLALHERGLPEHERQGEPGREFSVRRFGLATRGWPRSKPIQAIKYAECAARMVREGIRFSPSFVHANDFLALPIGVAIAKATGAKLIYDSHELWRGSMHRETFDSRLFELALSLEGVLARRADAVITVSDSIAAILEQDLRVPRPRVVRNFPKSRGLGMRLGLRDRLGIPRDCPIILYVGGTGPGYGFETLLSAHERLTSPAELVVLGAPPRSRHYARFHRTRFLGFVPPDDVVALAADATLGVCPIEDACASYRYSLPNKLFEYVQAGLPVVASDLPEIARLVRSHAIGRVFAPGDACALAREIDLLMASPELLASYRSAASRARESLSWEGESRSLVEVYRHVANRASDERASVR